MPESPRPSSGERCLSSLETALLRLECPSSVLRLLRPECPKAPGDGGDLEGENVAVIESSGSGPGGAWLDGGSTLRWD